MSKPLKKGTDEVSGGSFSAVPQSEQMTILIKSK